MLSAFRSGLQRVWRARVLLAGLWLVTLAVALPPAVLIREAVRDGLPAAGIAAGVPSDPAGGSAPHAGDRVRRAGLTLMPSTIGLAAVLDNVGGLLGRQEQPPGMAAIAGLYLAVWTLLAGGAIDRLARDRPTGSHGFFAVSGTFFFRFLRLGAIAALGYYALFARVHPWLFEHVYPWLAGAAPPARAALAWLAALSGMFALLLAAVNVLFDYAQVRAVVEDRRSVIGAIRAAARFIRRHAGAVAGVYGLNAALYLGVVWAYALAAPASAGFETWAGFVAAQAYVAGRLYVQLTFYASAAALFQARLAHAGYVAAPAPQQPDPPAAEAFGPPVR